MALAYARVVRGALALIAVVSLAAFDASAQGGPRRKPGLWQQTVTSSGAGIAPSSMSMCTDEKTDDLMNDGASAAAKCSQHSVRQQGDAFVVEAVCKHGATTVRTRGVFSGDFTTRYSGELRSTFEPPMHGVKEMTQRIDARWVGPCKPGQKPGDVTVEGMGGVNMREVMGADPAKLQEMMKQMQQMQQK